MQNYKIYGYHILLIWCLLIISFGAHFKERVSINKLQTIQQLTNNSAEISVLYLELLLWRMLLKEFICMESNGGYRCCIIFLIKWEYISSIWILLLDKIIFEWWNNVDIARFLNPYVTSAASYIYKSLLIAHAHT